MGERQIHGFNFELNFIKQNNLIKEQCYTGEWDAYDKEGIPYQIKCIKKFSNIDMGDFFRNVKKNKDFYLVVGFWEKEKNNIVEIKKIFIPILKWKNIFNGFNEIDSLKKWISEEVSNSYDYDEEWHKKINFWKNIYGDRLVKLRFKRDHKSQKRIQCAITYKTFINYFVERYSSEQ